MTPEEMIAARRSAGGMLRLLDINSFHVDEQGRAVARLAVTPEILNPQGVAHGGAIFTLCDSVAGAQAALKNPRPVTQEGSIHYYRPALEGTVLTATATERKGGRTIAVIMVEVRDDRDTHIADATFSMFYKQ